MSTQPSEKVEGTPEKPELTESQKLRIQRNKEKAEALRKSRLARHPYSRPGEKPNAGREKSDVQQTMPRVISSNGGFLIEEEDPSTRVLPPKNPVYDEVQSITDGMQFCSECSKPFAQSWLWTSFNWEVCDECKSEEHSLITKTEAKSKYLLKDFHLDPGRGPGAQQGKKGPGGSSSDPCGDSMPGPSNNPGPTLKYIEKQNTKHNRMGTMKLYLECAVIEKAKAVWGNLDKLEAEHDSRKAAQEKLKRSKFDKKMKELKMAVRSSLYKKDLSKHEHEFGPETQVDEDTFTKKCKTCSHSITYEKM